MKFMCLGIMYSGENDVCGVALSVISTSGKLKNRLDHVAQLTEYWASIPFNVV